jgi:phosphoribosylformylglycinamidine cyclo-ligase
MHGQPPEPTGYPPKIKKPSWEGEFFWCGRGDLNPHDRYDHQALNLARLPVPPRPHVTFSVGESTLYTIPPFFARPLYPLLMLKWHTMSEPLTYRDAGVDIDAGDEAVKRIRKILKGSTRVVPGGEEVGGIGGFSALFRPDFHSLKDPLLVSSTDGVGTKLLIALEHKRLENIGQDLVGMVVNDIVVTGARPLFFLDYLATAKLEPDQVATIVGSIQKACEQSECLLVGGECAEMPGMYAPGHTDLAGFGVGMVDRERIVDGSNIIEGDVVLGVASSGFHSNGFSLVRKVIEKSNIDICNRSEVPGETLLDSILKPTRLYVRPMLALFSQFGTGMGGAIKSCAHITGGGLIENPARVIPDNLAMELDRKSWIEPAVFKMVQTEANLPDYEMDRTYNRGIGFTVVVAKGLAGAAIGFLEGMGERVYKIGRVVERKAGNPSVTII